MTYGRKTGGRQAENIIGRRFGRLIVVGEAPPIARAYPARPDVTQTTRRVRCRCDCGNETIVRVGHLRQGRIQSCGCFSREQARKHAAKLAEELHNGNRTSGNEKHGAAHKGRVRAEWQAWSQMKGRCNNPKNQKFRIYGGRGIRVCAEWQENFAAFFAHIGPRPSRHHSVDRINNNGHYEPGNVRWATPKEQANNRRCSRRQREAVS